MYKDFTIGWNPDIKQRVNNMSCIEGEGGLNTFTVVP